jgi:glycosyl transferase, family 25
MRAQLDALAMSFEVVEAVNGRTLDATACASLYSEQLNQRRFYRPLTPGEIGCYASHIAVWHAIAERGQALALVLEDDVELGAALPSVLEAAAGLKGPWDLIKLVGRERSESAIARWPLTSQAELIRYARVPSLTGAYLISLSGARKLAQHSAPVARPIDVDLRHHWECGVQTYGVQPYPISLAPISETSTIGVKPALAWRNRWRKWRYQIEYSLRNGAANRRPPAPDPIAGDDRP